ncbi:hypothetical protein KKA20_00890 [Patescibacteria group bacterium]|nr:hypothetical protein [Patescibacteria group bacterium]
MDSSNNKFNKIIYYFHKAKNELAGFYFFVKTKVKKSQKFNVHENFDKKLINSLSKSKIPTLSQIKHIKKVLNKREIWIIRFCLLMLFLSIFFIGAYFYKTHLKIAPIIGGEYIEGLIGSPKHINPLYSKINDVDADIGQLIFSSILKLDKNQKLVNDLAVNYNISEDNKIYTFIIREDAKWHNEENVTVDDIIFTFNAIKNIQYQSPLRISFIGVDIEKIDNKTIKFILSEPYAAFLELLTFGILPQDLWSQIPIESAGFAELNLKPVGSGPYKLKSFAKDKMGVIKKYILEFNDNYYGKKPYIQNLSFNFFVDIEELINALNNNDIDGIGYLPYSRKDDLVSSNFLELHNLYLSQINAIFFNQEKQPVLKNQKVRQALAFAVNKHKIIADTFNGQARIIDGPILPDSIWYNDNINKYQFNLEQASKLLDETEWVLLKITDEEIKKINEKKDTVQENSDDENNQLTEEEKNKLFLGAGDWRVKKNEQKDSLVVTLTTVETNDNIKIVNFVKEFWEKIGVKTNINIVSVSEIQSKIIQPRNFEAFFYGQRLGRDPDIYAFWHSSQIGESGFNLANYSNNEVDQLLEDARLTNNIEERIKKYKKFQEILTQETPVIFLYSPVYTYVQNKKIKDFNIKNIFEPHDRFINIAEWYIKTGTKFAW